METESQTDREIVKAILCRDTSVTKEFLYRKCYPLFASIHAKYYTDCETPVELINEIYVYIMLPHKTTRRSKLQDFGFRCTLTMWLKIVTENYCRQLFARRLPTDENIVAENDRNLPDDESLYSNAHKMDADDLRRLLDMMPNRRYRRLIEARYVEERSNEDTAMMLGLTMANYYNTHKRAKAQYCEILRKEGLI